MDHITEAIQKYTILIVEDHQEMQHFIASILQKNYQLLIVNNGKEALERLKQSSVDLIISDVMMPLMDGYEVCYQIKENPETKDIPIIFVSALASPKEIEMGNEAGGDDYITKPFDEEILLINE